MGSEWDVGAVDDAVPQGCGQKYLWVGGGTYAMKRDSVLWAMAIIGKTSRAVSQASQQAFGLHCASLVFFLAVTEPPFPCVLFQIFHDRVPSPGLRVCCRVDIPRIRGNIIRAP